MFTYSLLFKLVCKGEDFFIKIKTIINIKTSPLGKEVDYCTQISNILQNRNFIPMPNELKYL